MTASNQENATAASAQSQGEAASARHLSDAQAQHATAGSTMVTEAAATPDSHSVQWSPADTGASPTLVPSTPPPVNSGERSPRDPT